MNNYKFSIAEADIRPVAQQPHGDRNYAVPWVIVSVMDQFGCQHRMHGQSMCHMLGISANTGPRKSIIL